MTMSASSLTGKGEKAKRAASLPYMPGVDGLRAIAVIAVIAYHSEFKNVPGGFLGVEIFFVISGYLITALLLGEYQQGKRIDLRNFWERRARRLLPALFAYVGGATALAYATANDVIPTRGEIVSTLGYVYNWFGIFQNISYTQVFERKNFFHHLWSLAVEEQFYLLWPLITLTFLKYMSHRIAIGIIVSGIAGSTILRWALYEPFEDPLRVYYGTDTRASALLIGALLAFLWRPWTLKHKRIIEPSPTVQNGTLIIGLAAITTLIWANMHYTLIIPDSDQLFRGGFLLTSVVTAIVIAAVVCPQSLLGKLLGFKPLVWVGKRSYGLYLWHWPVFQLTRPRIDVSLDGWELFWFRMIITLALVEVSYQYIERPIRERRIRKALDAALKRENAKRTLLKLTCFAVALIGSFIALEQVQANWNAEAYSPQEEADAIKPEPAPTPAPATPVPLPATPTSAPVVPIPTPTTPVPEQEPDDNEGSGTWQPPSQPVSSVNLQESIELNPEFWQEFYDIASYVPPIYFKRVTFIGDSVMEGALTNITNEGVEEAFRQDMSSIAVDVTVTATQNRQWYELPDILRDLKSQGELGEVVVIHLGNNGVIDEDMVADAFELLKDTEKVMLVNVRVPRRWENKVNGLITAAVETYENAELVDWYTLSNDHPEYFNSDGVHMAPFGGRYYIDAIITAIGGESIFQTEETE